jgi:[ribosomal protein S5]-alanine N-acetyltransferase
VSVRSPVPDEPTIETPRLVLRPFAPADAPEVQRLAGERDVASTTLNVPHPYEDGMAEAWIESHAPAFARGERLTCAVTERGRGQLLGAISLRLVARDENAELGYWIGKPYWGRGICTEAAAAVLTYGFETLGLHRIHASFLTRNPASGRVMQKIGMTREGRLREHIKKWDVFEDLEKYAILRSEHRARAGDAR